MRTIRLVLEYDGTRYAGWQRQENALSVQEELERTLERICAYLEIPFDPGALDYRRKQVDGKGLGDPVGVQKHARPVASSKDTSGAEFAANPDRAEVVARGGRVDAPFDAEQPKLRERRRFELVVGEDFHPCGMVDRHQAHLVEVGDLTQFLGDADLVVAVTQLQRFTRHEHILIMIGGEVRSIAGTRAERGNA